MKSIKYSEGGNNWEVVDYSGEKDLPAKWQEHLTRKWREGKNGHSCVSDEYSFLDLAVKGLIKQPSVDIDHFITEWHENPNLNNELYEYLGLTHEEYNLFVMIPQTLDLIIAHHRDNPFTYNLFLDDQINDPECPARHPPPGYVGARSSFHAILLINLFGMPQCMSLDHDLGKDGLGNEDNAMEFLKQLVEKGFKPPSNYMVHSANPIGKQNIISYIESWRKSLDEPGSTG